MIRNEPDPFQTILNNKVDKDMRPINKLTDLSIKQAVNKAKSSTKTIKISDGGGMYLQVHPNGSQYWRMNCRINGKQITLSFGLWPDVSSRSKKETRRSKRKLEKE